MNNLSLQHKWTWRRWRPFDSDFMIFLFYFIIEFMTVDAFTKNVSPDISLNAFWMRERVIESLWDTSTNLFKTQQVLISTQRQKLRKSCALVSIQSFTGFNRSVCLIFLFLFEIHNLFSSIRCFNTMLKYSGVI